MQADMYHPNESQVADEICQGTRKGADDDGDVEIVCVSEEGYDSNTDPMGVVLDYHTKEEVHRRESLPSPLQSC